MHAARLLFVLFGLLLMPSLGHAAVTIHEVAWMGTVTSANHEWIELYNDGGSETVDGWTLSDGMNLTILLSGTMPSQSYAVLERTSDDSAPGTAFLVYTGAMVNTGATLTLRRADGSIADQVSGGENWANIGGDNVTKETAQYTGSGWVTAMATPGAANSTVTNIEEEEEEETVDDNTSGGGGGGSAVAKTRTATKEPEKIEPSEPSIAISMPGQVYVNQLVTAKATVSNVGKVIAQSMAKQWNFGDLHTDVGETVTHRFAYPGEYIVSVTATYKDLTARDRVVVTVLPLALSVTKSAAGEVQLHNDSKYEVDVSEHVIRVGSNSVTIPPGTYLRPNATITIPTAELRRTSGPVLVYDSVGRLATHSGEAVPQFAVVAEPMAFTAALTPAAAAAVTPVPVSAFRFGTDSGTTATTAMAAIAVEPETAAPAAPVSLQAAAGTAAASPVYPYLGLVAVMGVGLAAVMAGRMRRPALEREVVADLPTDTFPFR